MSVMSLSFTVSCCVKDGTLRLRVGNEQNEQIEHGLHRGSVIESVAISDDRQSLISGDADGMLRVWELRCSDVVAPGQLRGSEQRHRLLRS